MLSGRTQTDGPNLRHSCCGFQQDVNVCDAVDEKRLPGSEARTNDRDQDVFSVPIQIRGVPIATFHEVAGLLCGAVAVRQGSARLHPSDG